MKLDQWAIGALCYAGAIVLSLVIGVVILRKRYSRRNKYEGLELRKDWEPNK